MKSLFGKKTTKNPVKSFGKKLSNLPIGTTQKLMENSYEGDKRKSIIDGYKLDESLSGNRAQVYYNDDDKKSVIVHRGTSGAKDIVTDALYATFGVKTKRFKHGEKIQNKAIEKYGKENLLTLGHSLGGAIGEHVSKGGETITLNKPVALPDINKVIKSNQIDIKTSNDPISVLRNYQGGNKPIIIPSQSSSLFAEHKINTLGRIN